MARVLPGSWRAVLVGTAPFPVPPSGSVNRLVHWLLDRRGLRRGLVAYDALRSTRPERHKPEPVVEPYVPGVTRLGAELFRPALLGFFASVAIFLGASQPNSPFTLKDPNSWYFGWPTPPAVPGSTPAPGQWLFLGVVAVYGGMLLMLRAWYDVVRITTRHPGIPVARLVPIFAAWVAPMLVVAPLFSRDLYSYAAQGEMMSHGINPYTYGPGVLGQGPFVFHVDKLWQYVPSPYGPAFLAVDAWIVEATGHNALMSVEGLRLLALLGTVLFATAVPVIAKSFGRDPSVAFTLAALNPLVILHLVGGGHNDAVMLGLLVAGYALARRGHPILGIVFCGFAASVKVPALIGAVYIGWEWLGAGRPIRERLRPVATALLLSLAVMAVLSEIAGLGWGWISGLNNPDKVQSWLDPATGIGKIVGRLVSLLGLGDHTHLLLTLARGTGLLLAGWVALRLLIRSEKMGSLKALGWSLIAIVVLSPVVQPWYASWGFVFLAPVAVGKVRRLIVIFSGIACFVGLPGGRVLVNELSVANPLLVAFAAAALLGILVLLVAPQARVIRRSGHPDADGTVTGLKRGRLQV